MGRGPEPDSSSPAALAPPARTWPGTSRLLRRLAREVADVLTLLAATVRHHVRLDVPIVIFSIVYLALFAPLIPRNTDNPQLLAAYSNDEPFLTMALEATLVPPYGNPGTYFDPLDPASADIPGHWGEKTYPNITYYGGAMFDLAFPVYAILRAVGLPPFPTGPIVLRTLTLLAGLVSLILLYNVAKRRGSRLAGMLAAAFVASDASFIYYANFIHPDTLQMLFGLLAFILAVTHARDGGRASLLALGLACGLVQGAKSGGAWTIPMALVAVWLGARVHAVGLDARLARMLTSRLVLLGGAALVAFFVSTPYAFLDSYYARSMRIAYGNVTQNTLQLEEISLRTWAETLYEYVGPIAAVLVAMTVARALWTSRRGVSDPALLLGVVLSLSQFLWYGASGKLWHVVGYLILSFGLMAVFAFETLLLGVRKLLALARRLPRRVELVQRLAWVATVVVVAVLLASGRWYVPASWAVEQYALSQSTVRAANDWAIRTHVDRDAVIVFDDLAYFDPERFPNAKLHGGVLTWPVVESRDPDYIVLSGSLFGASWMQNLIARQRFERRNPDPFNVRLYQDLLAAKSPGPTKVPGIELERIIRPAPAGSAAQETPLFADLSNACARRAICDLGVVDLRLELALAAALEQRLRVLTRDGGEPLSGPELRIFHVRDPRGLTADPAR